MLEAQQHQELLGWLMVVVAKQGRSCPENHMVRAPNTTPPRFETLTRHDPAIIPFSARRVIPRLSQTVSVLAFDFGVVG